MDTRRLRAKYGERPMNKPTTSVLKIVLAAAIVMAGGATLWAASADVILGHISMGEGRMSFAEMHARAHLDNLPVQDNNGYR
jgi:hypothetical protein